MLCHCNSALTGGPSPLLPASLQSIAVTGYIAFGNGASYNILESYYDGPRWAVITANAMVLVSHPPYFFLNPTRCSHTG